MAHDSWSIKCLIICIHFQFQAVDLHFWSTCNWMWVFHQTMPLDISQSWILSLLDHKLLLCQLYICWVAAYCQCNVFHFPGLSFSLFWHMHSPAFLRFHSKSSTVLDSLSLIGLKHFCREWSPTNALTVISVSITSLIVDEYELNNTGPFTAPCGTYKDRSFLL